MSSRPVSGTPSAQSFKNTKAAANALTGTQKAALVIIQLGKERAAKILQELSDTEVQDIMSEVVRTPVVPPSVSVEVWEEFCSLAEASSALYRGGMEFAREVLEDSLGSGKAARILDQLVAVPLDTPFDFLRKADPRQVVSFLAEEHPQTIALVLAHLHPDRAALVLSGLSEEQQRDVASRIAAMDHTTPEVIRQVEAGLERRFSAVLPSSDLMTAGGVQTLVDILNRSDRGTERLVLEGLEEDLPDLAEEVRGRMFVFEDIVNLDDRSIQLVLRQVAQKDLAVALKGVRGGVKDKIMKNLSENAALNLNEEVDALGPVRLKTVEESQAAIVRIIRQLEEKGELIISRGGEEFVT